MSRSVLVVTICAVSAVIAINRPVYKIVLTQKGFAQFVQYDVETPPIREFTFCTWLRLYDLDSDQSIFTYIVNGNNRVVRLWMDAGGRHMKVSFNERVSSSVPVEMSRDVWRHVCLSYQSDYGAWALYMDSRLASCEAAQTLHGFVIPAGGSVVVGYGTADNGVPRGLEGEIFGANMILFSTIERNYTLKNHPQYEQKAFRKNKIRGSKNMKYVILKDLQEADPKVSEDLTGHKPKSWKGQPPNTIDVTKTTKKPFPIDSSNEREILDLVMDNAKPLPPAKEKPQVNFWNLVNDAGQAGKFKAPAKLQAEQFGSSTHDRFMISEFETPPAPNSLKTDYLEKQLGIEKPPVTESIYKITEDVTFSPKAFIPQTVDDISDVEVPPPLQKDNKVYGQWTSSKFAGSVLNYLKSIKFYNKDKKVPPTIPLPKGSDNFPYASDLKANIVRAPTNLQRKSQLSGRILQNQIQIASLKRLNMKKRSVTQSVPQINVKILEDGLRSEILKSHAQTQPIHVEITNRGESNHLTKDSRLYRNLDSHRSDEYVDSLTKFNSNYKNDMFDFHKSNSLFNVLPFLKSVEYFTGENEDLDTSKVVKSNNMYTKSFSNGNKWHNIKSYNNDYTPRRAPDSDTKSSDIEQNIAEANKKHPSIRLKYKPETNKIVRERQEEAIIKGRELAIDVSNQSNYNRDAISIIKYNHGFLPGHEQLKTKVGNVNPKFPQKLDSKNNFNKQVKIGNALNERHVIGSNEEQKKKSFVGGDDRIPDINRYRSDIDNDTDKVPASLRPRVCKNVELYDNILYVQPDGSVDMTHILSPLKVRNIGIEFVMQNYQKCSLEESALENNYLLLINWNKTPVRLFGGAVPKKTKDLCGFFK
ncbi:uncharacterized protein LOC126380077 [Pectinophora gossypiella]|uniref:uncharacterized protein LOC126380077 n=1 Tax=Pectinophora gossypiella TaxID=13191 RepID=UPI00214F4B44|nr:uncharacterized protein LOC126380077 [Pectinophora gossypiella]